MGVTFSIVILILCFIVGNYGITVLTKITSSKLPSPQIHKEEFAASICRNIPTYTSLVSQK